MSSIKELLDDSKPMIRVAKAQLDLIVAIVEATRDPRLATVGSAVLREIASLYGDAADRLAVHAEPKSSVP